MIRNLAFFFAGLLVAIGLTSFSQPYIGGSIGHSRLELPVSLDCPDCTHHKVSTTAAVGQVFAGYDFGRVAVEIGAGGLSTYRSHNIGPLRNGDSRDICQEIDTRMVYARGIYFFGENRLRPFVSGGLARVTMRNHEYGRNDASNDFVEQLNYDRRTKPILGAGLAYQLTPNTAARLEITRINNVAVSHWTLSQNVTSAWAGLVVKL